MVRAGVREDDPGAYGGRSPAQVSRDPSSQPHPPIHRRHECLGIHDFRLQLDDEQASGLGVPGEDVDDPAFSVDREADLRLPGPTRPSCARWRATDSCMAACRAFITRSRSPPCQCSRMSTRAPRAVATDLSASGLILPIPPRSSRLTSSRSTPARRATSACRRPLWTRMARRVLPMRTSSISAWWAKLLHCHLRGGSQPCRYH